MRRRGRPVIGAVSGLFFGLFLALDLLFFGVVALDSIVLLVVPVIGLALGIVLGLTTPLRRGRSGGDTPPTEERAERPTDGAASPGAPSGGGPDERSEPEPV